jgi:uncharacterized repeat protein (TIGR03847 family)
MVMALLNLGLIDFIDAESHGQPGQRTFNITARSQRGNAVVWMEKEQLFQVGASLKQFIATRESTADPVPYELDFDEQDHLIELEFKTPQMTLKHDPASDVFTLSAEDYGEDGGEEPDQVVEFSFPREEAERLADKSLEIVASGRPPCPLCTGPLSPGETHFCVKVNGHTETGPFRLGRRAPDA